ncbi:tryptophan-rich sensory protein [Chloroflexota bacterium]
MKKRKLQLFAILNLIGFIGTVIVNGLSSALPINGKTAGELSDQYPNLFVPAGLTFSIWGLIYILLTIFVMYGLIIIIRNKEEESSVISNIGILFFISCIANIGWIFAWHYEFVQISLVLMITLLVTLIAIYLRLRVGNSDSRKTEKYLVHLPFSAYLGWITIATIANVTALLVYSNWDTFGLGEPFWAIAVIIIGVGITLSVLFIRKDIFYSLVVDWALLGILLKRLADSTPVQSVIVITITGLAVITIGIIIQVIRKRVY